VASALAYEVVDHKRRAARERVRMADDFREQLLTELHYSTRVRFPSPAYAADPVRFFREVLGVEPWSRQVELLNAVRDHSRVAVCSGHKVSKSHTCAGVALWYYCSHEDARVVMTSTTSRQVDQILWRELRMMRARASRCVACKAEDPTGLLIPRPCPHSTVIEGEQGELARTGLKSADFREIVGFTAREAEAVAGISGRNLLYIVDEASGVADEIFEAIEGNRAGGARILMCSNGTRNEGEFFDAFHKKAAFYHTMRISSEETPNVTEGREVIPGLATREWIEEKRQEWGEDSPLYKVRIKGEHATLEEAKIFSLHMIAEAEERWRSTEAAGRLYIGLDPAGEGGTGDESAFCMRRGLKQLATHVARGLDDEGHLRELLTLIAQHKLPRETPVVVIDRDGPIGASLFGTLRQYAATHRLEFELAAVRPSRPAMRDKQNYGTVRDELAANLTQWFRDGGAILEDSKLEIELHCMEWEHDVRERKLQLVPKKKIRKLIGRSPDRFDALCLAVWEPLSMLDDTTPQRVREIATERRAAQQQTPTGIDPYGASKTWR